MDKQTITDKAQVLESLSTALVALCSDAESTKAGGRKLPPKDLAALRAAANVIGSRALALAKDFER